MQITLSRSCVLLCVHIFNLMSEWCSAYSGCIACFREANKAMKGSGWEGYTWMDMVQLKLKYLTGCRRVHIFSLDAWVTL